MNMCKPVNLRCEYRENPIGIDETAPRLSWQMSDSRANAAQTAYQVVAATSEELLSGKPDLWDSGCIKSDQSLDIVYAGRKLGSRQRVCWQVRVWDHERKASAWSQPAFFEMGLLKPSDWKARWIGRPLESKEGSQPCPFLRRDFTARGNIVSARLYATARGIFEVHMNGQRVGQDFFLPGWTEYRKRIPYIVYDVGSLIQAGANTIGAILADGWYAGFYAWGGKRFIFGDQLSLLLQLELTFADGSCDTIVTGPDWTTAFGPLLAADHYNGEFYDARRECPGWAQPGFDASRWQSAVIMDAPAARLVAKRNLPVRRQEELKVKAQTEPQFGAHVFDLGQNIVGWARIKVRAEAGCNVRIRYAEMLNSDGTLYTANLRSAKCTDNYICKGGGEEIYEPRFTFHGFRYIELTGLREKPLPQDVSGIVVHSEIPPTGSFECSNPIVNQLQSNITWGQKGNFLEAPTDCPQRDERLGWTGDAQVFMPTACFNRDVAAFFDKWCIDLQDAQLTNGGYPFVAPDMLRDNGVSTAWGDAGVICPWTMYMCYGDKHVLARQYDSMTRWLNWHKANSHNGISTAWSFGDWLALDMQEGNPGLTPTPTDLISTAYFARMADLLSRIAKILGHNADAKRYAALFAKVKKAFNREFVTPTGRLVGNSQTAYLLALGFDLLPTVRRAKAVERLVKLIESRGNRLTAGFVGTSLLGPVLTRFGRTDVAYRLLLQEKYPSWIFSINQGATTMWERWNSYTRDKGFGDVGMNSFNHYAYGAIGEWMYSTVAGIRLDPAKPAYKHIIIQPQPGGGLTWTRGELLSRYGRVACSWKIEKSRLTVTASIPPNTTATVALPGRKAVNVGAGTYEWTVPFSAPDIK